MEGRFEKALQRYGGIDSDVIRQRGIEEITIEQLMQEVSTRGKHTVPPKIKADLVNRVKSFLESHPL